MPSRHMDVISTTIRCSYRQITRVGPLRLRQELELQRVAGEPLVNHITHGQLARWHVRCAKTSTTSNPVRTNADEAPLHRQRNDGTGSPGDAEGTASSGEPRQCRAARHAAHPQPTAVRQPPRLPRRRPARQRRSNPGGDGRSRTGNRAGQRIAVKSGRRELRCSVPKRHRHPARAGK